MKELKKCAICGVTEEQKIIATVHGVPMCSKHKAQTYRHGRITDPTSTTTQDKNKIILHDSFAELIVKKDNNTKEYHVIIDLDDVIRVKQHKWRYETSDNKKSGYVVTGKSYKGRIGLHRFIMNYKGPLNIDHINRNTLDNRKENLRIVPAVINAQNMTTRNGTIEKRNNNKYRVRIRRFKREFIFGLFDNIEDAAKTRDEFIDFLNEHEEILIKNFYIEKANNPELHKLKSIPFYYNGRLVKTKMFKTVEETVANRKDLQKLLIDSDCAA